MNFVIYLDGLNHLALLYNRNTKFQLITFIIDDNVSVENKVMKQFRIPILLFIPRVTAANTA